MFPRKLTITQAVCRVPARRLMDLVMARNFVIVDLDHPGSKKAPYSVPVESDSMISKYAGERNVALLTDSREYADAVAALMMAQDFPYNITLTDREDWVDFWSWDE